MQSKSTTLFIATRISLVSLLSFSLLTIGCGEKKEVRPDQDNNQTENNPEPTPIPVPLPTPTPQPTPIPGQKVCYNNNKVCYDLLDAKNIASLNKDYQYPDAKDFPNASLRPIYEAPIRLVNLLGIDLKKAISNNFLVEDYLNGEKMPFGLVSRILVDKIQKIRDDLKQPIIVTSGYRSPGYNKNVPGSAYWSRHTYGDSADFLSYKASLPQLKDLCEKHNASFVLVYTQHIHCDWRLEPRDTAYFEDNKINTRERYQILSEAQISTKRLNDRYVQLSVSGFDEESPNDLIYQWTIVHPDGSVQHSGSRFPVVVSSSGTHKVSVTVGLTVQLDEILNW